jgi:hypothetical protein
MSNLNYKNPLSPLISTGSQSLLRSSTFGTTFSVLNTGGFMEVYTLNDLIYTIPPSFVGDVEFSGNTIPIQFYKSNGGAFSFDTLTLNSDNISSGRRRLGMLAYVYETNQIYQYSIDNYDTLWSNARSSTGIGGYTVVISDFGTTVKNNSPAGQSFIDAWTGSTIEGVNGVTRPNARWRVLSTGGSGGGTSITGGTFNHGTETLSLYNSTGGTITITGFTDVNVTGGTYSNGVATFTNSTGGTFNVTGFFTGSTDNYITGGTFNHNTETLSLINVTGGTIDITGFTDVNVTGGTYSDGMVTFTNNTGGTFNVSGFTTPFTGGTVSGATIFTNGLTANTISATTYYNLPVVPFLRNETNPSTTDVITINQSIFNPSNLTILNTSIFIIETDADYYVLGDLTNNGVIVVDGVLKIGGQLYNYGIITGSGIIE